MVAIYLFYGEKVGLDSFWLSTLLLVPPVPSRRARCLAENAAGAA